MSNVFVLDTNKKSLNPIHPGQARLLLKQKKAAVLRRYPFTIVLKIEVKNSTIQPLRLKLDPGSKTTGIALVNDQNGQVVFAAELTHRGQKIKEEIESRRAIRKSRRARHTRYRKPRFQNRKREKGWTAPSLMSRVYNIQTWFNRLRKISNIEAISMELVRFDLQKMENPEISGCEYQQGTLFGYEVREYLLEKWNRTCAYCERKDIPLQIEHIKAKANGGTNRLSNLCLACEDCNRKKGTQDITVFLKKKPELLKSIVKQAKRTLKDASAVNSTRWKLFEILKETGLQIEVGSGGRTKFNRISRGLEKTHWIDASCVGESTPPILKIKGVKPLLIKATGHGRRQMCLMNKFGFQRTGPKEVKKVKGFQSGDICKAIVKKGKKMGTYVGKIAVRTTGYFNITNKQGTIQGIRLDCCKTIHRSDGYSY